MGHPFIEQIFLLLQQNPVKDGNEDARDAQWQYTQQTYGLARPTRDGIISYLPGSYDPH